jgi:hypothetical protein
MDDNGELIREQTKIGSRVQFLPFLPSQQMLQSLIAKNGPGPLNPRLANLSTQRNARDAPPQVILTP